MMTNKIFYFLQGQHTYSPHPGVEAKRRPIQRRVHGGPGPIPLRQRDKQCGRRPSGVPGEGPCRPGQDPEGLFMPEVVTLQAATAVMKKPR